MSGALWRHPVALALLAIVAVIVAAATFAIVPETRQAVILRAERPVGVVNRYRTGETFGSSGAGLIARMPFLDRLVWVDKRILDVDYDDQQIVTSDQQRLQVDAYARFRVTDPLRMVVTARSEDGVTQALKTLLGTAIRNELGRHPFTAMLGPDRDQVMHNIRAGFQQLAAPYGVRVVDVRIKHADLPTGSPLASAYDQMSTARKQQASNILSQGQKEAQIIQANADAQAAQIYAESFNKDPDFYDFYRAMQSYKTTFVTGADGKGPKGSTQVILSPENGYLRQFEARGR